LRPHLATTGAASQVVSDFLQSRLVGEGNVLRHLELLGFKLGYSQSPLMEYPFAISNLAVDLRDGLRLIKVAEVLTGVCDVFVGWRWNAELALCF
jgi:abnormal spindle-like microcephaly-associated protein